MSLRMKILPLFLLSLTLPLAAQDYDTRAWFKGNTHTHSLWSARPAGARKASF